MINFLNTAAQIVAAKSTISPDQKDLGAGTVASVVITGIVVVFIGLVLLILLVRLLLLVLILIAVLVLVFAVLHGAHLLSVPFVLRLVWPRACRICTLWAKNSAQIRQKSIDSPRPE